MSLTRHPALPVLLAAGLAAPSTSAGEDVAPGSEMHELEELYEKDPDGPDADKILWNLMIAHEKAGKTQDALLAAERLVQDHPKSAFVDDALMWMAGYHLERFDLEASLAYMKRIADGKRFKKSPHRQTAVHETARILETLGRHTEAAAYWEKLAKILGKGPVASEAAFKAALCVFKAGKWSAAAKKLKAFAVTHCPSPALATTCVETRWHVALSYRNLGKQKAFVKALRPVVDAYSKIQDPDPLAASTSHAAQAEFLLVEQDLELLEGAKLDPDATPDELRKHLSDQLELGEILEDRYRKVLTYHSPEWSVASLFRMGDLWETIIWNHSLPPCTCTTKPPCWDDAVVDDLVQPLYEAAVKHYKEAYKTGKAHCIMNDWALRALERLNSHDPDAYPLHKKGKSAPMALTHSQPEMDPTAP